MPLLVLSAKEAFQRVRSVESRWPRTEKAQGERLIPLAQPGFWPTFRINREELIFTVGSCFARNIEKQLIHEGYNVAASQFEPPAETGFTADPDALLNRYVVFSILNELRWALEPGKVYPKKAYIEFGPARWFDPHLHPSVAPSDLRLVRSRREAINRYMALAGKARVFIMTLGLAEAWFDSDTGLYLNGVLPVRGKEPLPPRFQLHLLDYEQILSALEEIHAILTRHGHPELRMLVTVSPVAMNTTFTGGEVLVANTYSKSVQRAALEAFVRRHDNVDYFPSYESVVLSDRSRAWRADQAHASDEIVRLNVLRMIEAYAEPDEADGPARDQAPAAARAFDLVKAAKDALARGEKGEASRLFRAAAESAPTEGLVLLDYGRFLLDQKQAEKAATWLEASVRHGGGAYGGHYYLAQALRVAHRYRDAHKAAAAAREVQPTRPGLLHLSADIALKLKLYDEAKALVAACAVVDPGSDKLLRLQRRLGMQDRAEHRLTARRAAPAAAEPVTICTVATPLHKRLLARNHRLVGELNPGAPVAWSVAYNADIRRPGAKAGEEAPADPEPIEACAPGAVIVPGPGLEATFDATLAAFGSRGEEAREHRRLLTKYIASYHHAAGLNLAMAEVRTRYAVVMDPDFYVVRPGWIAEVIGHMRARGLALFGAPWSPRWYQKFRDFPCTHFMVMDLQAVPWRADLFAPDLVGGGRRFGSAFWEDHLAGRAARGRWGALADLLKNLPAAVGEDIRQRATIGDARDTGYGLLKEFERRPELKAETVTAVFDPRDGFMPAMVGPLQASGPVEALLPDRLRYLPRRPGYVSRRGFAAFGLPDFRALGWEEFLWRGAPFAFHVRGELQRKTAGADADAQVGAGLEAVMRRLAAPAPVAP